MTGSRVKKFISLLCAAAIAAGALSACGGEAPTEPAEAAPPAAPADERIVETDLFISEIMSTNSSLPNPDGLCCDFIEIANRGDEAADLTGFGLSDHEDETRFRFPAGTSVPAGGFLVVWCDKEADGADYAPFGLSRYGGEDVTLRNAQGAILDQVYTLPSDQDHVLIRGEGDVLLAWDQPTPGYPNTAEGREAFLDSLRPPEDSTVKLSELCARNLGPLTDEDGELSDWIEIRNDADEAVDLGGWYLSDDPSEPRRWQLPGGIWLGPGEELLVFASGKDRSGEELHTSFALSAGESVLLSDAQGRLTARAETAGLEDGYSIALTEDGYKSTARITPGFPNTKDGCAAFQSTLTCDSPLMLWEVLPVNTKYRVGGADGYCDVIELRNVSGEKVPLTGYYLSDDPNDPTKWPLPSKYLVPGGLFVIYCTGEEYPVRNATITANFAISEGEGIFLWKDGVLVDCVPVLDVPKDASIGRQDWYNGFFYFEKATPGKVNATGVRFVSEAPVSLGETGVFDGVDSVTVELKGEGPIFYTLDGSIPTARSRVYTEPFTVTKSTVVRAVVMEYGALTSPALTLHYLVNEGNTFPVVSLAADPKAFRSMYNSPFSGKETAGSVALFDENGSFTSNVGMKMFGHKSLSLMKRSFKLLFKGRFDSEPWEYDIFSCGLTGLSDLVLRAGGDSLLAIFRDELFRDLAADFSDHLVLQRYRFCVMYVNGEYWGIYCIKEAYSEEMYAAEHGVSPESVTMSQAPVALADDFHKVLDFAKNNDLSRPENYEAFCSMVDIDSLIDWVIMESYSANTDIQQNLRYFRSMEEDGKWRFALYDLDWSFYYGTRDGTRSTVFDITERDTGKFQPAAYLKALRGNKEFAERYCRRLAEALSGPLSRENLIAHIDELYELLAPEVPREQKRWMRRASWEREVEKLRVYPGNARWETNLMRDAEEFFRLTPEEALEIFGSVPYYEPIPVIG